MKVDKYTWLAWNILTLSTRVSRADDRSVFINIFQKKFKNLIFHYHIWIQHDKCIWASINKPSIGSVVLQMAPWFRKFSEI